jgi:hypothetical protein
MADFRYRHELVDDLIALFVLAVAIACALMAIDFYTTEPVQEPTNHDCWLIMHDDFPVPPFTAEDCMP